MLLGKRSFMFLVAVVTFVGSVANAGGWRCVGRAGLAPIGSSFGPSYGSCTPSRAYGYSPSYGYNGCGVPRYTAPSCGDFSVPSRPAQSSGAYKRYRTFEGGWVLVDQNDFVVDSSERQANRIAPAQAKVMPEYVPAPTPAPRLRTEAPQQNRDLLSAPKRNQAPESRYEGVDFFNAPKR